VRITARGVRAFGLGVGAVALLAVMPSVNAQEQSAAAGQESKMQIEESETIATFLKRLEGKPVRLRLVGGAEEVSGKLVKVGQEVVYLTELSGREFFDAVIRIDQVAAVAVQTRSR